MDSRKLTHWQSAGRWPGTWSQTYRRCSADWLSVSSVTASGQSGNRDRAGMSLLHNYKECSVCSMENFHFSVFSVTASTVSGNNNRHGPYRLFIAGFRGFSRSLNVNNSQGQIFKAQPPLYPLLVVHSSHKMLNHYMTVTFYKLFTTMTVNTCNNI